MVVTRRMAATERIRDKDHSISSKQMKKVTSNGTKIHSVSKGWSAYKKKIQSVIEEGWALVIDPSRCSWWPIPILLLLAEVIINIFIIEKVKYTEIDWKAYMQEVASTTILNPVNGTTDYSIIKGDTGPLVYPAGFVWIFSALYKLTDQGLEVKRAQYIFGVLYLGTVALAFRLLIRSKKVPAYVLAIMCLTSYRIHSLYALRLFNDPVAMLLLYAAINAFCDGWWTVGSVLYSIAVSVKMNILLFSPALFLAYVATQGLIGAVQQVAICALVQFILGYPFLRTYPIEYLKGAFDIGRVFLFEWTVNWRFLPEDIFVHRGFHAMLLIAHMTMLLFMAHRWWKMLKLYSYNGCIELLLLPLYTCNFIGMVFARSLHYQFYIWYYHQLQLLVFWCVNFNCSQLADPTRLLILGLIELCWNTYPSTNFSSALLNICHLFLLYRLSTTTVQGIQEEKNIAENVKND